jgi:hypothetical protein
VAETTLVKQVRAAGVVQRVFLPGNTNLPAALGTP